MQLPIIDLAEAHQGPAAKAELIRQINQALTETGFMAVQNLGIPQQLLDQAYTLSHAFFSQSQATKIRWSYSDEAANFGYQPPGEEQLEAGKPAELKETFTMRAPQNYPADDPRWPSPAFRSQALDFYLACLQAAYRLQRLLANCLHLEEDFFVRCHSGENITLRLLHYPAHQAQQLQPGQLGAGAHTDYGLFTLLFQDDVGGLELKDAQGRWQAVPCFPGTVIINTGDLMERWSNGRFRSTAHRVQPVTGTRDRYSIAFFVDPDSATRIEALPSCVSAEDPPRYPVTTAGEHILHKLRVSHGQA